jgi:hypothetical protein
MLQANLGTYITVLQREFNNGEFEQIYDVRFAEKSELRLQAVTFLI